MTVDNLSWQVDQLSILKQISFDLMPEEVVGIIGPNGSGKSSLLKCIYRRYQDFTGRVSLCGKPTEDYQQRQLAKNLAVVSQEPESNFEIKTIDIVRMGLVPHKGLFEFDNKNDENKLSQALAKVDLLNKSEQLFSSLSGGEKQRALIARALVQEPNIFLMDEPTNHLDIQHQIEIMQLIRQLGIGTIVTMHDLNLAANFCDRLILLNNGEIVVQGSIEEVLNSEHIAKVFEVQVRVDKNPFSQLPQIALNYHQSGREG